jgi:hypothetical protein
MKKHIFVFLISVGLVILAHYLFNSPLTSQTWHQAEGMADGSAPAFNIMPFIYMFVGWLAYSYYYRWLYNKIGFTSVFDAVKLGGGIWAFIAFPVVTVHYIFLGFSWKVVALDGVSTLVSVISGAILLWALTIHEIPTAAKTEEVA